jgi:flagellar motor protein MotB
MFSISQADLEKFKKISEGMKRAFNGESSSSSSSSPSSVAPQGSALNFPGEPPISAPGNPATSARQASLGSSLQQNPETREGGSERASDDSDLGQLRRLLDEAAELESSQFRVTSDRPGEIRWVIQDSYVEGASRIPEDFWPLLERVARVLARFPKHRVRWEGYCDVSESGADRATLWQISAERALWLDQWMTREWERTHTPRPVTAEVAGMGSSRLSSPEKTRFSRAKNRRVELVISSPLRRY